MSKAAPGSRRGFGQTWWGRAWVDALEQRARLDPNRLPRGRSYARRGTVGELTIAAGEVRATVTGSRVAPYEVRVRVRTYSPEEWDAVLDALAGRLGHAAALLDGELPHEVAGELREAGLDPLPGAGEVQPRCSCPDWADPCKHSAAVCYLVAEVLDEDPFVVFELRGRPRIELLAGLRARRGGGSGAEVDRGGGAWVTDGGVPARQAWSAVPGSLPSLPLAPPAPGRPTVLGVDPPAGSGPTTEGLRALAGDAARRAWALAHGAESTGLELDCDEDLARFAAAGLPGSDPGPADGRSAPGVAVLAGRSGVPSRELLRWALAWRAGGPSGLAALRDSLPADGGALAAAREHLGAGATTWRNRVTAGDRQLRLGPDRRWYPFRKARDGQWDPDGPALEL